VQVVCVYIPAGRHQTLTIRRPVEFISDDMNSETFSSDDMNSETFSQPSLHCLSVNVNVGKRHRIHDSVALLSFGQ